MELFCIFLSLIKYPQTFCNKSLSPNVTFLHFYFVPQRIKIVVLESPISNCGFSALGKKLTPTNGNKPRLIINIIIAIEMIIAGLLKEKSSQWRYLVLINLFTPVLNFRSSSLTETTRYLLLK